MKLLKTQNGVAFRSSNPYPACSPFSILVALSRSAPDKCGVREIMDSKVRVVSDACSCSYYCSCRSNLLLVSYWYRTNNLKRTWYLSQDSTSIWRAIVSYRCVCFCILLHLLWSGKLGGAWPNPLAWILTMLFSDSWFVTTIVCLSLYLVGCGTRMDTECAGCRWVVSNTRYQYQFYVQKHAVAVLLLD